VSEHAWALVVASFGALGAIVASYVLIRAGRRDRLEDKQAKRDEKVENVCNRTTHIEGFLEARTDFRAHREE